MCIRDRDVGLEQVALLAPALAVGAPAGDGERALVEGGGGGDLQGGLVDGLGELDERPVLAGAVVARSLEDLGGADLDRAGRLEVDDAAGGGDRGVVARSAHAVRGREDDVLGVQGAAAAHGEPDHEGELALGGAGSADDRVGGGRRGGGLEADDRDGDGGDGDGTSLQRTEEVLHGVPSFGGGSLWEPRRRTATMSSCTRQGDPIVKTR